MNIDVLIKRKEKINNQPNGDYFFITWPKNFVFGQVLFSWRVCVCVYVCVSVHLYTIYLKKFFTDFDETWQDDV